MEATLNGVSAISATDIWAVGNYGASSALIEHWDGTSWSDVKSPQLSYYNYLNGVTAVSATDIWAVGEIVNSSGKALIEHWNGTKWSVVPGAPVNEATLYSVGVVSATDIWAVGNTYSNGVTSTLTEHWDGTTWSIVASPNPGDSGNSFYAVANIPGSNYVWAVGNGTNATTRNYYYSDTLTAYYC